MSILWTEYGHGVLCFVLIQLLVYMISAQMHYEHDFPTANVSTSWGTSGNELVCYQDVSMVSLILVRGVFACGFFCTSGSCQPCGSYLFGIFFLDGPQELVWSANRNHPVGHSGTLQFKSDGDLVLKNDDGSIVWSTNTSGKFVAGLNLTDTGNLVLFDDNNATLWQSFDHPTDCLLPGQKLMAGHKLTPSVSPTNWSELGFFALSVADRGLFASAGFNPPQVYYQFTEDDISLNNVTTYVRYENGSLGLFYNSSQHIEPYHRIYIPPVLKEQYMRFGSDGHLRVYERGATSWLEVADLLTGGYGNCSYPTVCGSYGICSNGQCFCPPPTIDGVAYFEQRSYRQPNLGCYEITSLSCEVSLYSSTFLKLKDTSYITSLVSFQNDTWDEYKPCVIPESCKINITLERCKEICSKNCSCKAVIFQYRSDSVVGNCYLPSHVFSFMSINRTEDRLFNSDVYVKVQNVTKNHNVSTSVPPGSKRSQMPKILGSVIGSLVGLIILIGILMSLIWKKGNADEAEEDYLDQVPGMPTRFSYDDLKSMTENFSKVLGKGGFGSVFEGALADGTKIAVKQLTGLDQVRKSFLTEVEAIGSIQHVNLVRLLGFCAEKIHRLLVYEYMPNGSLDKWIFHKTPEFVLNWEQRKKIILDVAKGLTYLHEDCRQKIIHLDIKPQNILLDDSFNAKISDFGLSKLIDRDQSKVVTKMRGTIGYLAPEWLSSEITEKVDIYSFGVVVLEILCGRRNLDRSQPEECVHLLSLFERKADDEENRLLDLVDGQIEDSQFHGAEILNIMKLAAWCLQRDYAERPPMSVVVNVLEGVTDVENALDYNISKQVFTRISLEGTQLPPSFLSGPR